MWKVSVESKQKQNMKRERQLTHCRAHIFQIIKCTKDVIFWANLLFTRQWLCVCEVDCLSSKVLVSLSLFIRVWWTAGLPKNVTATFKIWRCAVCKCVFHFPWEMLNVLMCKTTYVAHLVPQPMRHILIETWKNAHSFTVFIPESSPFVLCFL